MNKGFKCCICLCTFCFDASEGKNFFDRWAVAYRSGQFRNAPIAQDSLAAVTICIAVRFNFQIGANPTPVRPAKCGAVNPSHRPNWPIDMIRSRAINATLAASRHLLAGLEAQATAANKVVRPSGTMCKQKYRHQIEWLRHRSRLCYRRARMFPRASRSFVRSTTSARSAQ